MSRKPFDDVAATMTTTVRLTPDDRARIDRQIAMRTDLPEPSISALLRRLVRCADEGLAITLPREERALLEMLVRHRAAELQRLGVVDPNTALSSLVIRMIRDTAAAQGFAGPPAPSEPTTNAPTTSTTAESTAHDEPTKATPPLSLGLDAAAVQAALRTAVDEGASQRSIARRAEIDPGQLSRFLKEGAGLSSERLSRLASALEKKA